MFGNFLRNQLSFGLVKINCTKTVDININIIFSRDAVTQPAADRGDDQLARRRAERERRRRSANNFTLPSRNAADTASPCRRGVDSSPPGPHSDEAAASAAGGHLCGRHHDQTAVGRQLGLPPLKHNIAGEGGVQGRTHFPGALRHARRQQVVARSPHRRHAGQCKSTR